MPLSRARFQNLAERGHAKSEGIGELYERVVMGQTSRKRWTDTTGILDLLSSWKALRWKGARSHVAAILPEWISANRRTLEHLERQTIGRLRDEDFNAILLLAGTLKEQGLKPTCYGKLLHFLLPGAILLWDQAEIRNGYEIDSDPYEFVRYQGFGKRLALLVGADGRKGEALLISQHEERTGHREPFTKILDDFGYLRSARQEAIRALGGYESAFKLFSSV